MKLKRILIIGIFIGLFTITTLIYEFNVQSYGPFYLNTEQFKIESDPNVVTRRNLILNYLRLDFWVTGMKGFSNGIGGGVELSETFEGLSAVTSIFGQAAGMSLDFLFQPTSDYIDTLWNITLKAYGESSKFDVNIYSTYYAVASLELIGRSADSNIVNFIDSLQNVDGGFGSRSNESSSLSATLYAILLLKKFGRLDLINNATDWIIQTQNLQVGSDNYGAFSSNKSDPTYTIYSSYEAISGLYSAAGNFSGINVTAAAQWIAARQNLNQITGNLADYGGFGNPNDIRSSMPCSMAAVIALKLINRLSYIRNLELIIWVFSSQAILYGGFASSPATGISSVSATYNALEILKVYNWPMLLLFTQIPWQLKPELHWTVWVLIIIITIVIIVMLLYLIWRRGQGYRRRGTRTGKKD